MARSQRFLRLACFLLVFLLSGSFCVAADQSEEIEEESQYSIGGSSYAKHFDSQCQAAGALFANDLKMTALFSNAFYDTGSHAHLRFHIHAPDGAAPQDMVYQIPDLNAQLLDALSPPVSSSPTPLIERTIWSLSFEEYNQDDITDILPGIGCFKPQAQGGAVGQGDSVVYLSSEGENTIWLRQREDVNKAIASLPDYEQAGQVIRPVLSKKVASQPPAPEVVIATCFYQTENGPDVLTFNGTSGAVIGSFPKERGTIAGIKDALQTRGVWRKGSERGDFELVHDSWGYSGKWKNSGDPDWRGHWKGKILSCE